MELTDFLDLLNGVRKQGSGYQALCPVHDDNQASLHVTSNDRGLGVKCHAGCDTESIVTHLGLDLSDLFNDEPHTNGNHRSKAEVVAEYNYCDEEGRLLYQVVRLDPKSFRQRKPDRTTATGWTWSTAGVRRVPYLLPELLTTDSKEPIFIVEGEKDVHTLKAHGYTATTNAGGAGKWDASWSEFFVDRIVIIIPDNDESGKEHARDVAESLDEVATVRLLELFDVKDVTDWFIEHDKDEFPKLVENAPLWGRIQEDEAEEEDENPLDWERPATYGLFGEIVQLIEPHTEADSMGIYTELMVHFGNCLGPTPHYLVEATPHYLNLFLAICGQTAVARKGTGHGWATRIFKLIDPSYIETCVASGLASGEGLVHLLRDPKTKVGKDGSVEVLDEGAKDKRKLFFESEFAGRTITAMNREGSTLATILQQAWDRDPSVMHVATKQNSDTATNAHVSVVGHCTLKQLMHNLKPTDIAGGFANRFIYIIVSRSKKIRRPTEPDEERLRVLASRVRQALDFGRRVSRMRFSPEALDRWDEISDELDLDMENADVFTAQFIGRNRPNVIRMACILALTDLSKEIKIPHLEQAYAIWQYSRRSVDYMLVKENTGLSDVEERLYKFLTQNGPCNSTAVMKGLHWSGGQVKLIAGQMHKKKLIEMTKKTTGQRGRPAIWLSV